MSSKKELLKYPQALTDEMLKRYPDFFEKYKIFLRPETKAALTAGGEGWPNWCLVPITCASTYLISQHHFARGDDPIKLTAYAAWNTEKIILDVDETLLNELNIDEDVSQEALFRLPYFCPYVGLPENNKLGCEGFFVMLDHDISTKKAELRVLTVNKGKYTNLFVGLDPACSIGRATMSMLERDVMSRKAPAFFASRKLAEFMEQRIRPFLPLILYLASENPDFAEREIAEKSLKKKPRKASTPKVIDVGFRIGAKIREYEKASYAEDPQKLGGHVAPHMRRAHWHSFWTGPRDGERRLIVKWLPPIPVGVDDKKEIIPTIRELGK